MSKVYFRYGAMNSGKSLQLLSVAHNYEAQGKKVVILKPSLDTRSKTGYVESRTGLKHLAYDVSKGDDLVTIIFSKMDGCTPDCVLVDEAQFLTEKQIKQLCIMADELSIPVIAYGLKNSYITGELFEGSKYLLYYADKIEEIKTVCTLCNRKAIFNLRIENGKPIYDGEIVKIGDIGKETSYYLPVCRKCYFNPKIKEG